MPLVATVGGVGLLVVVVLLVLKLVPDPTSQNSEQPQERGSPGDRPVTEIVPADPVPADYVVVWKDEPSQFTEARRRMIAEDMVGRDITDPTVLRALGKVPRQEFVPDHLRSSAYADHPLPIGQGQTISQPYIVALMTQLAGARKGSRALDIGTGSGYQAAVLAEICAEVYSIEIVEPLATQATDRLARLGYATVTVRHGDGYRGWPDKAPFDVIVVAAAPGHVPPALLGQLAKGGRLVIPVGNYYQELLVIERDDQGKLHRRGGIPVRFVPMTGEVDNMSRSK